ncbi:MAG TPA: PEP/pyruvate-binding domain-containing protein [Desulfobacterales bacterium]|nr:PEP/pyruvate-binding domain-containing protein [Desulfobacterales bacterium]
MFKFFDWFRRDRSAECGLPETSVFHRKYASFKGLLLANNRALETIAELEHTIYQDKPFTYMWAVSQTEALSVEVNALVKELNALSGERYPELTAAAQRISGKIFSELLHQRHFEDTSFVLPIERLSLENAPEVGGKAANLGEVSNRAHLPVPPGFAVTAYGYQLFLDYNELSELIATKLKTLDINDTDALMAVSQEIQNRIMDADLPADLEGSILQAARELSEAVGPGFKLAVRSSATSEDSEASFAGQHSTVLNVNEDNLVEAYKEVVASTFSPRAIYYRRRRGYRDQDVNMSVACIVMIPAKVSGVMYTVDPNDSRHAVIMISAVWGLAADAVEGSVATDFFQVGKRSLALESATVAEKKRRLKTDAAGGVSEESLPPEMQQAPCLSDAELRQLAEYGLKLETHYGYALDIEWAIDPGGKLFILQARPLKRAQRKTAEADAAASGPETALAIANTVLLQGGQTACDGAAAGVAYVIESDHMLHHIPEGVVVVARQTSPRYVPLMGRIRAFITDVGSVTGHMASVAREFTIPTLVGTGRATQAIRHGDEVTVDATRRVVYAGRVDSLLKEKPPLNPMKGSPTYKLVKSVLKRIAPLNLTDPQKDSFAPSGCKTLHDIIRFAHEMSMREMFRITDQVAPDDCIAVPLRVYLPMKVLVVDLGNGLRKGWSGRQAELEDVASVPFRALLAGMKHELVDWSRTPGLSWGGFASIVAQSAIQDPMAEGRMGAPSYAVIAGHYLNFNSRLGYHFTTIDSYCGQEVNDNYITFYFKGGAADIGRRSRRALMITQILKQLDFKVELKGDMVRGEIKKYEEAALVGRLDLLGRLLGTVRLLDMHLSDDRQVDWYVEQFMRGNYRFEAGTA